MGSRLPVEVQAKRLIPLGKLHGGLGDDWCWLRHTGIKKARDPRRGIDAASIAGRGPTPHRVAELSSRQGYSKESAARKGGAATL